jgi:clan AA aspartic protease
MGTVYAEITLKNVKDIMKAEEGLITEPEIRQTTVQAVVDTGAMTLVINERLRCQLGLEIQGTKQATLADDTKKTIKIAETVEVCWKNRSMTCRPLVAFESGEVLLGAIPLEDMDLIVDPVRQILSGAHGEEAVSLLL